MFRAPGPDDPRQDWLLREIAMAQRTLDEQIAAASALPDSDLSKSQRLARYRAIRRETDNMFGSLDKNVRTWADRDVPDLYRNGWFFGASQTGAGFDFTLPHRDAIDVISYDAYDDIATRLQQLRTGFDETMELQELYEGLSLEDMVAIQGRTRSAVAQALLTGNADPRKVARQLAQDLWKDNPRLKIVDAGGKHWDMQTYTRMLVRTKSANAYNAGSLNKYAEEGVQRVEVFDGVEHDAECAKANGQTWTLRQAMQSTIAHPNCRRAFAPKPGGGTVDVEDRSGIFYTLDRVELSLATIGALRSFRRTGEINVSSTLARIAIEMVEYQTGVPLFFVDGFIQGLASDAMPYLDAIVESYIDPILFNVGLINQVPTRAQLIAARRPGQFIDLIDGWVRRAAVEAFGEDAPQKVQQVLDQIDIASQRIEETAGAAIAIATRHSGGLRYAEWVSEEILIRSNELGRFVGETLIRIRNGENTDVASAVRASVFMKDRAAEVRELQRQLLTADLQEAEEIFDEATRVVNFALENLRAEQDALFGDELYALFTAPLKRALVRIGFDPEDVAGSSRRQNIRALLRQAVDAQLAAERKIVSLGGTAEAMRARRLAFPQSVGEVMPAPRTNYGTVDELEDIVDDFAERVGSQVEALAIDTRVVTDMQRFMLMLSEEGLQTQKFPEVAEVYRAMARYIRGPGRPGTDYAMMPSMEVYRFWEKVLGVDSPLLTRFIDNKASRQEDLRDVIIDVWRNVEPRPGEATAIKLHSGATAFLADEPELAEYLVRSLQFLDEDFFFEYAQEIIDAFEASEVNRFYRDSFRRLRTNAGRLSASADDIDAIGDFMAGAVRAMKEELVRFTDAEDSSHLTFSRLEAWLENRYGQNAVSRLGEGAQGTLWRVVDEFGRAFVVKPNRATSHTGDLLSAPWSVALNSAVARRLGSDVIPYRVVSINGEGDSVFISQFVHNADESNGILYISQADPDSMRRLALFHYITGEFDFNGRNFFIDRDTAQIVRIDHEMGFSLIWDESILLGQPRLSSPRNAASMAMHHRMMEEIKYGGDELFGTERLTGHYPLTDAERTVLSEIITDVRGGPVLTDGLGAELLLGRHAPVRDPRAGMDVWDPVISLGDSELEFVLRYLDDPDTVWDEILEDARDALRHFDDEKITTQWPDGSDSVEALARSFFDRRLRQLIDVGMIDISGGVTSTTNKAGTHFGLGALVDLHLDGPDPLGTKFEEVRGIVLSIWEDTLGRTQVRVLTGFGQDLDEATLRVVGDLVTITADDYVDAQGVAVRTLRQRLEEYRGIPEARVWEVDEVELRPDLVQARLTDEYGLTIGFAEQRIAVTYDTKQVDRFWFVDSTGGAQALRLEDVARREVSGLIYSELSKVPARLRPKRVQLYGGMLDAGDGPRLGFFDADTGTLHVSMMALTRKLPTQELQDPAKYGLRESVDGFKVDALGIRDISESLDYDELRRVIAHEMAHSVQVGGENARRARVRALVMEQLLDEYPLTETADDLIGAARDALPLDVLRQLDETGEDPLIYLLNLREDIVADIINTNLVLRTQDLLSDVENIPDWAFAAFEAARRGEPDGHHEVFAEIWAQVARNGGGPKAIRTVAKDLGLDDPGDLRRYLNPVNPGIPQNWAPESREFLDYLTAALDPRATAIIPERGTRARILWDQGDFADELVNRLLRRGGFTYDMRVGQSIRPVPFEGYAVAIAENEEILEGLTEAELRQAIVDYVRKHQALLDDGEYRFGGWREELPDGTIKVYLDTTKIFDDPVDAAQFGFANNQRAGFDLTSLDEGTLSITDVDGEIPLLNQFETFEDWLEDWYKGRVPYEEYVVRRNRIASMVADTKNQTGPIFESTHRTEGPLRKAPVTMRIFPQKVQDAFLAKRRNAYNVQLFPDSPWADDAFSAPESFQTQWSQADARKRIDAVSITSSSKVSAARAAEAEADVREALEVLYEHGVLVPAELKIRILSGTEMRRFGAGTNAATSGKTIYVNQTWRNVPSSLPRNRTETIIHELAHSVFGQSHPKIRALSDYAKTHPDEAAAEGFLAALTGRAPKGVYDAVEEAVTRFVREEPYQGEIMRRNAIETLERAIEEFSAEASIRGQSVGEFLKERYDFYTPWHNGFVEKGLEYDQNPARLMSAAALISPQRDADNNYVVAMRMADIIWGDKKFTAAEIDTIRSEMLMRAEQYLGFSPPKPDEAAMFQQVADTIKLGARPSDFGSEVLGFMLHPLIRESVTGYIGYRGVPYSGFRNSLISGIGYKNTGMRAIQVLRGEVTIDEAMRGAKVRPFFNNILDPLDTAGIRDITIDYHMMNLLLRVLGSDAQGVQVDSTGKIAGIDIGMKGFAADVLRDLFDEGWGERLGLESDAQLQEILWGIWRDGLNGNWWGDLQRIKKR